MDLSLIAEMLYCFFIMKRKASVSPDTPGKGRQCIKSEIRSFKVESHTQRVLSFITDFGHCERAGENKQMLNGGKKPKCITSEH